MSAAKPLDYAARCERYARQRGWAYDEHRHSIGHLTPRQYRRAIHKEGRAFGLKFVIIDPHDDGDQDWDGASYEPDGHCVTPGCDCCGGE